MREELLDPRASEDDLLLEPAVADPRAETDPGVRPRQLDDFVGQAELKEHLAIVLRLSTTSSSPGRPGWARPPWPASWPTSSA